jgi:gas vesicle protein
MALPTSKKKKKTPFEQATETPTFAGTNKPLTPQLQQQAVNQNKAQPQSTGIYNKEKGGYVTPQTTYPTTNPDFVPSAKGTTTQIQFNKDNSIDYTPIGGEPIKLTREEYRVLQGGAGAITNKVKEVQASEQPQIEQLPNQSQQIEQEVLQTDAFDLRERAPTVAKTAEILVNGFDTVAGLIPGIGKYLRISGKSSEVQRAEQTFNDMNAVLSNDVQQVKMGSKNKSEVMKDMALAREATLRLYAQTKGQGQLNLGFWVDSGASIEAELARQKSILDSYIGELNTIP